jgi:CNT family concentrative nucleoside transporter
MQVLWGIGGMVVLLAIAFLLSNNRRAINPRTVFGALAIQVVLGVVVLYWVPRNGRWRRRPTPWGRS